MSDKIKINMDIINFLCGEDELSPKFLDLLSCGGMSEKEGWNIKNYLISEIDSDKQPDIYFKSYFNYQYKLCHGLVNYKDLSFFEDMKEEDFVKPTPSEFYSMKNYPREELDKYCSGEEYSILVDRLYPQNVDEAIDSLLDQMKSEGIKKALKTNKADFCTNNHFGLGMFIRNHLGFNNSNSMSLSRDISKKGGVPYLPDSASNFLLGELWDEIICNGNNLYCVDCGFEFYFGLNNIFYYDHITGETVDFEFDFSQEGLGYAPFIKGYIKRSYCSHCGKYLDNYVITEINSSEYDKSEIINSVSKGIKKHMDNFLKNHYVAEMFRLNNLKNDLSFIIRERENILTSSALGVDRTFIFNKSDYSFRNYDDFAEKDTYYKDKMFIDVYMKTKKSLENYFKNAMAKNIIKAERTKNTYFTVEINLSDNDMMLDLIKEQIQEDFNYHLEEKEKIKCPICNHEIYEEFYFGLPCPECGNDLKIKR